MNQEKTKTKTTKTPKQSKRKTNPANDYLNKEDLNREIRAFYNTGKMSNELGKMIQAIVNRYLGQPKFSSYSFLNDIKSDVTFYIIQSLNKKQINPDGNAFSYITAIIYSKTVVFLKNEKQQQEFKKAFYLPDEEESREEGGE